MATRRSRNVGVLTKVEARRPATRLIPQGGVLSSVGAPVGSQAGAVVPPGPAVAHAVGMVRDEIARLLDERSVLYGLLRDLLLLVAHEQIRWDPVSDEPGERFLALLQKAREIVGEPDPESGLAEPGEP